MELGLAKIFGVRAHTLKLDRVSLQPKSQSWQPLQYTVQTHFSVHNIRYHDVKVNSETATHQDDQSVVLVLQAEINEQVHFCNMNTVVTSQKFIFKVPERNIQRIAESETSKHWTIYLQVPSSGSLLVQFASWNWPQYNLVGSYTGVCYNSVSFETEASASKEQPRVSLLAQCSGWRIAFFVRV